MLVSIFNDGNSDYIQELQDNIEQLKDYNELHYEPEYRNTVMDSDSKIVEELELATTELIPTLFFIDPFGFQGLSLTLIYSVLKDWGSDGIFFFNYQKINRAISNPAMKKHMEVLFGKERLIKLNKEVKGLTPRQRESLILDYLMDAINEIGGNYVLDFRFPKYGESRTSHYLIFVTKHIRGYKAMKEILASNSNSYEQGVASFEFDPSISKTSTSTLPGIVGPIDTLASMIFDHFKGHKLTMSEVYDIHDIGESATRHYTKSNYKQALLKLEEMGKIEVDKPPSKRIRKGIVTLGDDRIIKFKK